MNSIPSCFVSSSQCFSVVTKKISLQLTAQHKRTLLIIGIATIVFTTLFLAFKHYFGRVKLQKPSVQLHASKLPSFTKVFPTSSPPSSPPSSPKSSPKSSPPSSPKSSPPSLISKSPVNAFVQGPGSQPSIKSIQSANKHPSGESGGIFEMEQNINNLQTEIEQKVDLLSILELTNKTANPKDKEETDAIKEAKLELNTFNHELEDLLKQYPDLLGEYLKNKFIGNAIKNRVENNEIYTRLVMFSGFLDNHKDNREFVYNGLNQIDLFLAQTFFTSQTELCLQEESKINLIIFHVFFDIANKHLHTIEKKHPKLAENLKIKLANLPLRDDVDRENSFPNIYLSDKDQLQILSRHFQSEEDRFVGHLVLNLTQEWSDKDINKLSRMVINKTSLLSQANLQVLQRQIKKHLGIKAPKNWNDSGEVLHCLNTNLRSTLNYCMNSGDILNLHRASKAKHFFDNQIQSKVPEDQILIPRWYHATKHNHVKDCISAIITSGQVNVEHKQQFNGSWVSTQREGGFGESVFVFNHSIAKLDPNVFIGYEKGKIRWRGLQVPIPLINKANKASNLSLVGLYQGVKKVIKTDIVQKLQKIGIPQPTVVSVEQVDYIQREIIKTIGNPNLSDKWWGKADLGALEKIS